MNDLTKYLVEGILQEAEIELTAVPTVTTESKFLISPQRFSRSFFKSKSCQRVMLIPSKFSIYKSSLSHSPYCKLINWKSG